MSINHQFITKNSRNKKFDFAYFFFANHGFPLKWVKSEGQLPCWAERKEEAQKRSVETDKVNSSVILNREDGFIKEEL